MTMYFEAFRDYIKYNFLLRVLKVRLHLLCFSIVSPQFVLFDNSQHHKTPFMYQKIKPRELIRDLGF